MKFSVSDFMGFDAGPGPRGKPRRRETVLKPIQANAGIEAAYRAKIADLIKKMHDDVVEIALRTYARNPPEIAADELSWRSMADAMRKLARRWLSRFDVMAEQLAEYFGQSVADRTDAQLKRILKDGGISLENFTLTRAQRDVLGAIIQENVSLIKSIPEQYFTQIEGIVMRSVQAGYDGKLLSSELQKQFGVTKKRAVFIARDQTRKATALLQRTRFVETGVKECIWMHSSAGKTPRPTHVKAGKDQQRFDPAIGWLDPAINKRIWPGTEINCRCTCRAVIPGIEIRPVKKGFAA